MANYDEVVSLINSNTYPHVARTADPLLVRPEMLSLMVGDVIYNAKIKNGLGAKGYTIYVNGNGTPIYENIATTDSESSKRFSLDSNLTDDGVKKLLNLKAKEWLDNLEKAIAKEPSDSAIKKAIDRMCWQLHYDITESHANFPVMFKSDDFSDVKIDRYPLETMWWDGCTLKSSISDIAGVTHKDVEYVDPQTQEIIHKIEIDNKGYLSDSAANIKTFDDHLTKGFYGYTVDQNTNTEIVEKGSLCMFNDNLIGDMYVVDSSTSTNPTTTQSSMKTIADYFTKGIVKLDEKITSVKDGALHVIAEKIVPDDVTGKSYYSISECLRDHDIVDGKATFSIARSLREGSENSVSQATHDQTKLEEQRFTDIDNTLGTPSDSTANTVFGSISVNASSLSSDISGAESTLSGEIGNVQGIAETISDTIGTRATGTRSLMNRIGETTYGSNTIFGEMDQIYESMFGKDVGQSGGHYGFVRGPGWVGQDWSNWVATE